MLAAYCTFSEAETLARPVHTSDMADPYHNASWLQHLHMHTRLQDIYRLHCATQRCPYESDLDRAVLCTMLGRALISTKAEVLCQVCGCKTAYY